MSNLLDNVKRMARDLGVSLDAGEVSKALDSHRKGQVKAMLQLCDPNTVKLMKESMLQKLQVSADPDVVSARTLAKVQAKLSEAATLASLGEDTLAQLDRAERFVKSIGKQDSPKQDSPKQRTSRKGKGKGKSKSESSESESSESVQ